MQENERKFAEMRFCHKTAESQESSQIIRQKFRNITLGSAENLFVTWQQGR